MEWVDLGGTSELRVGKAMREVGEKSQLREEWDYESSAFFTHDSIHFFERTSSNFWEDEIGCNEDSEVDDCESDVSLVSNVVEGNWSDQDDCKCENERR